MSKSKTLTRRAVAPTPVPAALVIYVAGPISAPTAWQREANIRRAEWFALALYRADFAPICVHSGARMFYGEIDEEVAMKADFAIIERCDALLLVTGWQRSKGTLREIAFAHKISKPVFQDLADLIHWRKFGGGKYEMALQMGALRPETEREVQRRECERGSSGGRVGAPAGGSSSKRRRA
jgi:nucleoside 2-deoxyribosyltransferase